MIVVTGLMRSGTSPISMMLNAMGVPMGTYMRMPTANRHAHCEWEDVSFTEPLYAKLIGADGHLPAFFHDYIKRRSIPAPWGVKSPFALPFIGLLADACKGLGESLTVIVSTREYADTIKSLEANAAHLPQHIRRSVVKRAIGVQERLFECIDGIPIDTVHLFPMVETVSNPEGTAARLAGIVGIEELDTYRMFSPPDRRSIHVFGVEE